jgi:hypothetical protein
VCVCVLLVLSVLNVSSFCVGLNEEGIEMKKAAFRGRRLMGSTLTIPHGYQGTKLNPKPSMAWATFWAFNNY